MPIRGLLKNAACLQGGRIITGAGDELQANGKMFLGEAARNRKGRQTAKIADSSKWIGKRKIGEEIRSEGSGGDRL